MFEFHSAKAAIAAVVLWICVVLYRQMRISLQEVQHSPEEHTYIQARANGTKEEIAQSQGLLKPPYPIDTLPGSRQVETVYGIIHVFEWGPEEGEKVLLVHGLGTPSIALGDMAKDLVRNGYRVMLYDLFGRGYSDAPNDLDYDARLYTTQLLLVLASSPLSWTGNLAFHIIGFSLGGSIAVALAAYHATMLRSMTLVCPGGLIRTSHMGLFNRVLYSSAKLLIPEWLRLRLVRSSLQPKNGAACADVPGELEDEDDVAFDDVPVAQDRPYIRVGDVIKWQLESNEGFVQAYLSTLRSALVYRRHDHAWRVLAAQLARRRTRGPPLGLPGGKIHLILADRDVIVVGKECAQDAIAVLGAAALDIQVMEGGHEIAMSRARDIVCSSIAFWTRQLDR